MVAEDSVAKVYYLPLLQQYCDALPPPLHRIILSYVSRQRSLPGWQPRQVADGEDTFNVKMLGFVNQTNLTGGREHKLLVVLELYDYLVQNRRHVLSCPSLQTTALNKLTEFHLSGDIRLDQYEHYAKSLSDIADEDDFPATFA